MLNRLAKLVAVTFAITVVAFLTLRAQRRAATPLQSPAQPTANPQPPASRHYIHTSKSFAPDDIIVTSPPSNDKPTYLPGTKAAVETKFIDISEVDLDALGFDFLEKDNDPRPSQQPEPTYLHSSKVGVFVVTDLIKSDSVPVRTQDVSNLPDLRRDDPSPAPAPAPE